MRIFLLASLLVLLAPHLRAQDLPNSWNTRFPVPGLPQSVNAVAVEGDAIVVMTAWGIRIFREGRWERQIALPDPQLKYLSYESPVRPLALYNGQPWVAGGESLFRYVDGSWEEVEYPDSDRAVEVSNELAVVAGELFVAPDLHRWTGDGWESLLPDSVTSITEAVVSASGRRWLLRGVNSSGVRLLEEGEMKRIDPPPHSDGVSDRGIAFAGEDPVVNGFRYRDGAWVELSYPDEFEPFLESIPAHPIVGGATLYAISPVWDLTIVSSSVGGAYGAPCSNRLYRLDDTVWRPVSGYFDRAARAVASWGSDGAIVGGAFLGDDENFVSDGVVGFDDSGWSLMGAPLGLPFTGVAGIIEDVTLHGDSLWIVGDRLYANGLARSYPLLFYTDHAWHGVDGISGATRHITWFNGDVYVAGSIVVDGEEKNLVRLRGGEWEEVAGLEGSVVEMKVEGGALYVGTNITPHSKPIESLVYRLRDEKVEAITPRWKAWMNTFAVVGNTIYLGGKDHASWYASQAPPAPFAEVVDNRLTRLPGPRGVTVVSLDELPYRKYIPPSIDALHWHDGWLYVGGQFDSVADLVVGSIARFDGTTWEGLDEGVARARYYSETEVEGCGPFAFDQVSSIGIISGSLVAAGKFRRIGALDNAGPPDAKGVEVSVPLGLYDFTTGRWRPAASYITDSVDVPQHIRAIHIADGRLAIVGEFTLPGSPASRNVAVAGRTLSVEGEIPGLRLDLQ